MNTVTKPEAIDFAERGWAASHPQTGGWLKLQVRYDSNLRTESRTVLFYGDCSPQTGWEIEYPGER